ncbi:hypothetical protein BV898_15579 [Hypsibius exemplaris]|uniref:Uncharacterized protein n=1 Tax=Hypsibius exemplaris TaxID=2072580 RepID=A0A9X6RKG5_HYPEX|nr:hypothetical protein BV898_15579 [Hypsibius exemplaris]
MAKIAFFVFPSVLLITCFLAEILSLICVVGFREQSATVALGGFGHISRITVLNVFGLLLTFCCFVLEQLNDNPHLEASQLNQTTLQEAAVNVSASIALEAFNGNGIS